MIRIILLTLLLSSCAGQYDTPGWYGYNGNAVSRSETP